MTKQDKINEFHQLRADDNDVAKQYGMYNKTIVINNSRNLILKLRNEVITITRDGIVEYKAIYIDEQVALSNFKIMSILKTVFNRL